MESLIENGAPVVTEEKEAKVPEQIVQFRKYSDFQTLSVKDDDGNIVASLSGYGLECGFDFKYMKSQDDINDISKSIADVIMQVMVDAAINAAGGHSNTDTNN